MHNFFKFQALGNDFIITKSNIKDKAKKICDRNFGVGADGLIIVKELENELSIEVFNQDGSMAQNCGNGLRCVALWYFLNNNSTQVNIKLADRNFLAKKIDNSIEIDMGDLSIYEGEFNFKEESLKIILKTFLVNIGNKHIVFLLKKRPDDLSELLLNIKTFFSDNFDYNLGFLFIENNDIYSFVYERGVGFTKACGTGAMAALSVLCFTDSFYLDKFYEIKQEGGSLLVKALSTESINHFEIVQKGSAELVFYGQWSDQ